MVINNDSIVFTSSMFKILTIIAVLFSISACGGQWTNYPVRDVVERNVEQTIEIGDALNVNVFNETNLSGDYPVLADGTIQIPLIGSVVVDGMTLDNATKAIAKKFVANGYLVNPKITLSVAQSRTVKIIGEIRETGEFPFTQGMTILDLVAKSGGFSYRANQNTFDIVRRQQQGKTEKVIDGQISTHLMPGDIVRVKERFF